MDVHASLRFLRMSPRKVRLVIDVVRGLPAVEAETRLGFINKEAARPVLKLLQSAIANAENNFHLDRKNLVIAKITADGGPTIKRSRPRAFGRAAAIRKRTTHINIILAPKADRSAKPVVPAKPATEPKATELAKPAKAPKTKTVKKTSPAHA